MAAAPHLDPRVSPSIAPIPFFTARGPRDIWPGRDEQRPGNAVNKCPSHRKGGTSEHTGPWNPKASGELTGSAP
jgi:hypothetical protein